MSVTLTVVISTTDQPRLQAALAASGIANPGALIAARINQIIEDYEAQQAAAAASAIFQSSMDAHAAAYVPVAPIVTVTPGP